MNGMTNVAKLVALEQAETETGSDSDSWPQLLGEAFHGIAGEYVRKIEPHTEADPAAILVQFLVMYGNLIGRGPYFRVEADQHHLNMFAVLVGASSKGRKGVSAGQAKRLMGPIDEVWSEERIQHGLSSGEGLIWAVRDPVGDQEKTGDPGVEDKRILIIESEFASPLQVMKRSGNTLSPTIRTAWDTGKLQTLTKKTPTVATGAHVSILGHITKDELRRYLSSTEQGNGFANRFLWCLARRSKCLPEGGTTHQLDFSTETGLLQNAVRFGQQEREVRRNEEAKQIWAEVYPELSEGKPGLLGSVIGRAEAQAMRLACLYALLDKSSQIQAEHLLAALSLWDYCEASARWIFGNDLGDPIADKILDALRVRPLGLTRTEISKLFSGHKEKKEIDRALSHLFELGLITPEIEETDGRAAERWKVVDREGSGESERRS